MSTEDSTIPGEFRWRLDQLERRVTKVETEADDIAVLKVKLDLLSERVKVMTAALWSVAGGLVLVAVTVVLKTGGIS